MPENTEQDFSEIAGDIESSDGQTRHMYEAKPAPVQETIEAE